jgi:hypothetical protein
MLSTPTVRSQSAQQISANVAVSEVKQKEPKPEALVDRCDSRPPACVPEPQLTKYFDVLQASYGGAAARVAASVLAGEMGAPLGDDQNAKSARMIIQNMASNPGAAEAARGWLRRLDGASPPPCDREEPQDPKALLRYIKSELVEAYGVNAVKIGARSYLHRRPPRGCDEDAKQGKMLAAYFEYLSNRPVLTKVLRVFLEQTR